MDKLNPILAICFLSAAWWMPYTAHADDTAQPAQDPSPRAQATQLIYQAAIADPSFEPAFQALVATLPKDSRGFLIMEGDLLYTEAELKAYLQDLGKNPAGGPTAQELIVDTVSGKPNVWPEGKRRLTYWVEAGSFTSRNNEKTTRTAFRKAADDWEAVSDAWGGQCGNDCRVRFVEVQNRNQALFVLRYQPGSSPIARAFFPDYAASRRVVEVFDPFFDPNLDFDPVGVLRHELGHVLGYRHEHIRNPAILRGRFNGCYSEGNQWKALTPYQSRSVMHYLCDGTGDRDLKITNLDEQGHKCAYVHGGPPCP